MKKTIISAIAVAIAAAMAHGAESRTDAIRGKLLSRDRDYVFVAMHRGDWRNFPENSRDAILSCIALGADIVELDAQRTKDGRFVLNHDDSLDRTTTGKGKIADLTLAEIKQFRLREGQGGENAKATDYEILTLEEGLAIAKDRILVNIDKFGMYPYEILEAVDAAGAIKDVLVKSSLSPADAKSRLGKYWERVESGELLYMPIIGFCWGNHAHADAILPEWTAEEPRAASMYEVCMDDEKWAARLESIRNAPGHPRIWINTMWNSLNANRAETLGFTDPGSTWGWSLSQGATMIQTDYGAELIVYLNRLGRRNLNCAK